MRALFAKSIFAKKGQHRLTYSGVLRPGYIRFQDEFQLFLFTIYFCTGISDFQPALKGSSAFVNSYGFLVDHTH